ncbi:MAG: alginate export family protein [bacterium]
MKKILIGLLSLVFLVSLTHVCRVEAALENISLGGDIRIRGQYAKNNNDLDDDTYDSEQIFRQRTRLWIKGDLAEGFTGYVRVAAEPRWGRPDYAYNTDPNAKQDNLNMVIIDNAYIEAKDFLGMPVTLKIGRQDLTYGEGFLVFEGTPGDGSRTIYFDAIKLSSTFGDATIDLFTAKADEGEYTQPDDEDLYGLYYTNRGIENHTLEAYGLHKARHGQEYNTTAVGIRSTGKIVENLSYGVEVAKQFGKAGEDAAGKDIDRDALGGLFHVTYGMPEVTCQPKVKLGFYYTSGDDDATDDKNKAWDGFYTDFPKFGYGDMLATISKKNDPGSSNGVWSNHTIFELDVTANITPKMCANVGYLLLQASEDNAAGESGRGSCPQVKFNYQFTENVSGHWLAMLFDPGEYYGDDLDDAMFTRFELFIKF